MSDYLITTFINLLRIEKILRQNSFVLKMLTENF